MARVEPLQQKGEMLRCSEVTDDEQLDERFKQMDRAYKQVCQESSKSGKFVSRQQLEIIQRTEAK